MSPACSHIAGGGRGHLHWFLASMLFLIVTFCSLIKVLEPVNADTSGSFRRTELELSTDRFAVDINLSAPHKGTPHRSEWHASPRKTRQLCQRRENRARNPINHSQRGKEICLGCEHIVPGHLVLPGSYARARRRKKMPATQQHFDPVSLHTSRADPLLFSYDVNSQSSHGYTDLKTQENYKRAERN